MEAKRIQFPLDEKTRLSLKAGDRVLISGTMLTGRDAAHQRLFDTLTKGLSLPVDLQGEVIYYVGPAPASPGHPVGSAGPTSSYRMDAFTPALLDRGLKGMMGKGDRNPDVIEAIIRNRAVYFVTLGGLGASLAQCILKSEILAYPELGPEAIHRFWIQDFPAIVAIDATGKDLYPLEQAKYKEV